MKHGQHKTLLILESLIYSSGQMFFGLLLHPYRSTQVLVKNKILLPYIFYPFMLSAVLYTALRFNLIFSLYHLSFVFRFVYQMILFFFFYWQMALFYLWFRFSRVF